LVVEIDTTAALMGTVVGEQRIVARAPMKREVRLISCSSISIAVVVAEVVVVMTWLYKQVKQQVADINGDAW